MDVKITVTNSEHHTCVQGLNHLQFDLLWENVESEIEDLSYYTSVCLPRLLLKRRN
jgi:hypothetical protein